MPLVNRSEQVSAVETRRRIEWMLQHGIERDLIARALGQSPNHFRIGKLRVSVITEKRVIKLYQSAKAAYDDARSRLH